MAKEIRMQVHQMPGLKSNRLRFVFGSKVVSFGLSPHATYEDVAVRLDRLAAAQAETPIGIDLTFVETLPRNLEETIQGFATGKRSC